MEIKYQVWDKIGQRMIEGAAIYENGDHVGFADNGQWPESIYDQSNVGSGDDWLYLLDNFIIRMYTGLKDRNGREIYAGDLIAIHGGLCLVEFTQGAFMARKLVPAAPPTWELMPRHWYNRLVVGTIYQQPSKAEHEALFDQYFPLVEGGEGVRP